MRSDQVARRLLQRGTIGRRQFDDAVRSQGFFGGELESHLLKLGHVSEAELGSVLSEVHGVPYASGDHLRSVSDEARNALPRDIVERLRVCPFEVSESTLRVAMLLPRDRTALTLLERTSGLVVDPWVTCEYRLYSALERHWRIRPEGVRAIALAPPDPRLSPSAGDSSATASDARQDIAADAPAVGLDGLPLDLDKPLHEIGSERDWLSSPTARAWLDEEETKEASGSAVPDTAPVRAPLQPPRPLPRTTRELGEDLSESRTREEIAEATLSYALGRAARAALFAVGKEGIRGVAGGGRGFEDVRRVHIRFGSGTVFDLAGTSGESYVGPPPPLPPNRDLYTALGGRLPSQVMIVPVAVKGRLAAFLYVDGDDAPIERPDLPTFRRVAAMTGLALELILLQSKLREG